MAGNYLKCCKVFQKASRLDKDTAPSKLAGFTLNVALDRLILTFDETVDASSLKAEEFTLHNGAFLPSTVNFTLSKGGTASDNGTVVEVVIGSADMNVIKQLALCSQKSDCFLIHSGAAVRDMEGLFSDALLSPQKVDKYVKDNISAKN